MENQSSANQELEFENTLVLFLDIVGYGDFLKSYGLDFRKAVRKVKNLFESTEITARTDFYSVKFHSWILSDSFILVVDTKRHPLHYGAVNILVGACSSILTHALRYDGFAFRGAIGAGNFYKSDEIMLSTALVDAVKFEKMQNWLGVMISPDAQKLIEQTSNYLEEANQRKGDAGTFVRKGRVPMKSTDPTEYYYVLPMGLGDGIKLESVLPSYFDLSKPSVSLSKPLYEHAW